MVRVVISHKKTKKIPLKKIQKELFEKSIGEYLLENFGEEATGKIEGDSLIIEIGSEELVEIDEQELLDKSIKRVLKEKGFNLKGASLIIKK